MPLALLVAPSDPRAGDPASRREALAWLRGQLARYKFDVVIVGAGKNPHEAIEKAAPTINPGDSVLVHVSGCLVGRDALGFGGERSVPLRLLTEAFASRSPADLSFAAELTYEDDPTDPAVPHALLAAAVQSFGAQRYGYPILAVVRRISEAAGRIDFTRAVLEAPGTGPLPPPAEIVVSAMHHRAMAASENRAAADAFLFVRGRPSGDMEIPETSHARPMDYAPEYVAYEETSHARPMDYAPEYVPHESLVAPLPPEPSVAPPAPVASPASAFPPPSGLPWDNMDEAASHERPVVDDAPNPLDAQIADATNARDWTRAVELRLDRVARIESPKEKVRELIAVARILQAELRDSDGAISALEQARDVEPLRASTLHALRRGYESLSRWPDVAEVLGTLADVTEAPDDRAAHRFAQAHVLLDRLADPTAATAALRAALDDDPMHAGALDLLVQLQSSAARGEEREPAAAGPGGLDEIESSMAASPLHGPLYARAFEIHSREGNADAALMTAMAIEELGAAQPEHRSLLEQGRSVGPVRARAPLDAAAWAQLRAPGFDDALAALFAAVESAAVAAKLDELRDSGRLPELDRAQRLSETSTASVVRSFQWAARFLGIRCPDLYAMDDAPGVAVMHAPVPSTALGRSVVSGRSAKDLAFLAGRHLTYYRPEHHVLLYYPSREALTELLFACVQLGMPSGPSSTAPAGAQMLRSRLAPRLGEHARHVLTQAVRALGARGGQAQIGAWMRGVELTAARAGLFLCGDLATATSMLRNEARSLSDLSADERRGDLAAFCASRVHGSVRARFVALGPAESMVPPPMSTGRRLAAS